MSTPDAGKAEYEADVALWPKYHDGTPRPAWEALSEAARWSWNRSALRLPPVSTEDSK